MMPREFYPMAAMRSVAVTIGRRARAIGSILNDYRLKAVDSARD